MLAQGPAGGAGSSSTPTSVAVIPLAGPLVAVKLPSYDRNSTTCETSLKETYKMRR